MIFLLIVNMGTQEELVATEITFIINYVTFMKKIDVPHNVLLYELGGSNSIFIIIKK